MDETWEHRQARIVWEALQRAAEHLAPDHPAGWSIRRALCAAEAYSRALSEAPSVEDRVLATNWGRSSADDQPPGRPPQSSIDSIYQASATPSRKTTQRRPSRVVRS